MKRLIRPDEPGDSNGTTMGFILLLVGLASHMGHWMPVAIASMTMCLGLALISGAFGSAGVIKARKFVVTGTAAIAIALFVSVEHLRCEPAATCSCTLDSVAALTDRVLPT